MVDLAQKKSSEIIEPDDVVCDPSISKKDGVVFLEREELKRGLLEKLKLVTANKVAILLGEDIRMEISDLDGKIIGDECGLRTEVSIVDDRGEDALTESVWIHSGKTESKLEDRLLVAIRALLDMVDAV